MTWTTPFTAVTGAVITSAGWNTSARDNLLHLRALLPDPTGSGQPLVSSSTTGAAFASSGGIVPSGLVAMFRTAAAIATGWTRESNLDGRIPVGAGTTFSVTYTEATNYGSSWAHAHAMTAYDNHGHVTADHSHSYSHTHGMTTGGESSDNGLGNNGGVSTPAVGHTHSGTTSSQNTSTTSSPGGLTTGVAVSSGGTTESGTWAIPSRAYVFAIKD